MMNDPYAKYRDEIRAKGMTATPLRLGIAVGHAGDDLPSPYPKGTRGDQLYRDGLELGRLRRANEAGRAAAPEPPAQEPGTAAEIEALRAECERLRADAARLDALDRLNAALNARSGTVYRWRLILSPNVVRLMADPGRNGYVGRLDLSDSHYDGLPSCRDAIDEALRELDIKEASNAG